MAPPEEAPMAATLFRITLEVGSADEALAFYGSLLGAEGRKVGGGRVYFDCGATILALLATGEDPTPIPEYVYFAVDTLEVVHERARALDALASVAVHDAPAGEIVMRPWG